MACSTLVEVRSGLLLPPGGRRHRRDLGAGRAARARERDVVQADDGFAQQLAGDQRQHGLRFGRQRMPASMPAPRQNACTAERRSRPGARLLVERHGAFARVGAALASCERLGQFLARDLPRAQRPLRRLRRGRAIAVAFAAADVPVVAARREPLRGGRREGGTTDSASASPRRRRPPRVTDFCSASSSDCARFACSTLTPNALCSGIEPDSSASRGVSRLSRSRLWPMPASRCLAAECSSRGGRQEIDALIDADERCRSRRCAGDRRRAVRRVRRWRTTGSSASLT